MLEINQLSKHQSRHKCLTLVIKSKPNWPNAAANSVWLLRTEVVNVHSLPSAPTVQELIIICFHLLLLLCQILNEFTDSVTLLLLSVSIDCVFLFHNCHLVPVTPAFTLELSSDVAQELSTSPDLPMPEDRKLQQRARDALLMHNTVQLQKFCCVKTL